jgi:hypothetical protein
MAPSHVEAQLTAHRVELLGAGVNLRGAQTEERLTNILASLLGNSFFNTRAAAFAQRYREFDPNRAADHIVGDIEDLLRRLKGGS